MELNQVTKIKTYSLKEVAAFMELSEQTIRKMVKGGKIRSVNVAGSGSKNILRFFAEDIQEYYDALKGTRDTKGDTELPLEKGDIPLAE